MNLHSLPSNTFEMSKFHFSADCGFDYPAIQVLNSFICDWMLVCDFIFLLVVLSTGKVNLVIF